MLQHLELLFGRALEGRIEITGIHTDETVKPRTRPCFFPVDSLDAAADYAVEINREPGRNVYVGAALRRDDVFPASCADDQDFLKTYAVWADADDDVQVASARAAYHALNVTPTFVVVTGRVPTKRAQLWWPLETPIDDIDTLRATLRGIAAVLKTDPKVCTGKQLMRLAGTVAWPKKDGRILERTEVVRPSRAAREFTLEQMQRAFPPLARAEGAASSIADVEVTPGGALGLEEVIMNGREGYAFRLVRAHLHEWIGATGSDPTPDELYRSVAPVYLKKADQVRPGRGPEFLKQKCVEAVRAFHAGQIPFMRDLEEAVLSYAAREANHPGGNVNEEPEDEEDAPEPEGPFRASDLIGEPPERRWVVRDWIVEGAVNSLYGDGGLGKTLLAQQLACAVSHGAPWLGLETVRGSVLALLCEDDKGELWRRHNDIKAHMGHTIGNPFDDVWLWPRVGDDNVWVRWDRDGQVVMGKLAAQIAAQVETLNPTLLILDTLADFYGGNEIDRPQVNYFVKTVLGGLIKAQAARGFPLTILLLGHPSVAGKASGSGYSGSTAWNNAVRSRMYLARPEEGANDERVLTRGKANYASSGDETALRLVYASGVLHAQQDIADGDSLLWAAARDLVEIVDTAWRNSTPFSGKKEHARFIYAALPPEMAKRGFGPEITRQVIRQAIDDGAIKVSASNGKRGYKGQAND